jgi:hypothetical protein
MAHSKALIIGGFVRGPSTGGVESLCDEVVGRKPRRRCRPQNTTGPRQLLVSADRRHGRQRRQAPPPDLHNSELEDAGYESAACCLSDELGACVVQLQNPLRHRERSRPTNFLERSLGEVRQRRPRFAADERVSGENDRAAGATDALGERSVGRAPSSERNGSGRRVRRRPQLRRPDSLDVSRCLVSTSSSVHLRS